MTPPSSTGNPTVRAIVVLGLSLAILAVDVTDVWRIWRPIGVFGYGTNLDGVVTGVDAGSPAAAAGIRVGDRLDESTMTAQQRWDLVQLPAVAAAGISRTFGVFRSGERRTVTLTSVPEPMGLDAQLVIVLNVLAALVFVGIGAAIVLLRPDPSTWGFFLYCLGLGPLLTPNFNQIVPVPWVLYAQYAFGALLGVGMAGLAWFALHFLQTSIGGWRRWAQYAIGPLALALVATSDVQILYTYAVGAPAEWWARAGIWLTLAAALLVVAALVDTFVHRRGADRQRIRWVVFGFAISLFAMFVSTMLGTEATNTPFVVTGVLQIFAAIAPVTVAYAVIKHRVIDVNFVVSRTLVYAILTTVFVGLFALIDWFVGRVLDQTRWALVAEIGVAIGVGFWLNGLHARVDRFVDAVLFRRRHAAERRLARLVRGLPHATSPAFVDASLVDEPRDALDLTSAALFRRDGLGSYRRLASFEWDGALADGLKDGDPLILHLQAERGAIRLSELHWSRDDAPGGGARPALALPIVVRHELEAIVLYGAHRGGEDFDPDELQWLNSLAVGAGAAYDHLEADALRQRLDQLARENESQRLTLERNGLLAT